MKSIRQNKVEEFLMVDFTTKVKDNPLIAVVVVNFSSTSKQELSVSLKTSCKYTILG